jgi:hypothetical protein
MTDPWLFLLAFCLPAILLLAVAVAAQTAAGRTRL